MSFSGQENHSGCVKALSRNLLLSPAEFKIGLAVSVHHQGVNKHGLYAVFALSWLPRDPKNSRWFMEKEAAVSTIRYENEFLESNTSVEIKDVLKALMNWKVWAF
jgi:hypothetical protein